jgi:hypothetical protein
MLMASNPPSKDTDWQTGLKRKTPQTVVLVNTISLPCRQKQTLSYGESVEDLQS